MLTIIPVQFFIYLWHGKIDIAAPLHNQHNAATTPLLSAVNKSHSSANRTINKLTGNSSGARGAIDGGHSPSPDFNARSVQYQNAVLLFFLQNLWCNLLYYGSLKLSSCCWQFLMMMCIYWIIQRELLPHIYTKNFLIQVNCCVFVKRPFLWLLFTGPRRTVPMLVIIYRMKWRNSCTPSIIYYSSSDYLFIYRY